MKVKNIFVNLIMKTYENQGSMKTSLTGSEKIDQEMTSHNVSISPNSTKRLFSDLMEHSLKKGLNEVHSDEN